MGAAIEAQRAGLAVIAGGGDPAPAVDADRATLLRELTERLGVEHIGAQVIDAQVFGAGPTARVRISLSTGHNITFEKFSQVSNGAQLGAHVVSYTGVVRAFKNADAAAVASLVFRLSRASEAETDEVFARGWGIEYLAAARLYDVDMRHQMERWRAFSHLKETNPALEAGDRRDADTFASFTLVLRDVTTGQRLVRAGWFQTYVTRRQDSGGYGPAAVASLMLSVGWHRNGKSGRVHARQPKGRGELLWAFLTVPPNWEAQCGD